MYCQDGHIVDKDLSLSQSHKRIHTHTHTHTLAHKPCGSLYVTMIESCASAVVSKRSPVDGSLGGSRSCGVPRVLVPCSTEARMNCWWACTSGTAYCTAHTAHVSVSVCQRDRERERKREWVGGCEREGGRERERERVSVCVCVCVCVCMCRDTAADTTYCICTLDARCFTVL